MRVKTQPGTHWEKEERLADVVEIDGYMVDCNNLFQVHGYAEKVAQQNALLIELLVEKGVLELADLDVFDVPPMEKA